MVHKDPNIAAQLIMNSNNGIRTVTYNGVPLCGAQYAFNRWDDCAGKNTKPEGSPCQSAGQCN